ncbi:MAG: hypothetical protein EXX96DRAFT_547248, partial [Benjaminiella poitrasii]
MSQICVTLFNATSLPRQAITPILNFTYDSTLLLLTETWLLPPLKYPTNWKQYHTYGIKRRNNSYKGQQVISLLVNPQCPYHVHFLPHDSTDLSQYKLSFIMASIFFHCLYLPPHIDTHQTQQILTSLPLTMHGTTQTVLCGNSNARMGTFTGDYDRNSRGALI